MGIILRIVWVVRGVGNYHPCDVTFYEYEFVAVCERHSYETL